MGTYNSTTVELRCPRCHEGGTARVDLYVGSTHEMTELMIGDVYPFEARRQPQNGGPVEGVVRGAGYAECPACTRDFFCDVEIRGGRLGAVVASTTTAPYGPDAEVAGVACPTCGSSETRHHEYLGMAVGRFICDGASCDAPHLSTERDEGARVYRGAGVVVRFAADT